MSDCYDEEPEDGNDATEDSDFEDEEWGASDFEEMCLVLLTMNFKSGGNYACFLEPLVRMCCNVDLPLTSWISTF